MKKSQTEIDFLDVKLKVVDGNKISTTIYLIHTDIIIVNNSTDILHWMFKVDVGL